MRFTSVAAFLDPTHGHHPTTAERDLIEAVKEGRNCWLCDRKNPTRPAAATDQTRIRADLLRLLITLGSNDSGLPESGVSLFGGWIEGPLQLAYCTAWGRTALHFCRFPEEPRLEQARFHLLSLRDSQLDEGLYAQGMRVTGSLYLNRVVLPAPSM